MENLKDLRTIQQFALSHGYTAVRIRQFIDEKRIAVEKIAGKIYVHKDAAILPSKTELKRLKRRESFEKSLVKKK